MAAAWGSRKSEGGRTELNNKHLARQIRIDLWTQRDGSPRPPGAVGGAMDMDWCASSQSSNDNSWAPKASCMSETLSASRPFAGDGGTAHRRWDQRGGEP